MTLPSLRANRINFQRSAKSSRLITSQDESHLYKPGDLVLVSYGPALNNTVKFVALNSQYYGTCRFLRVKHPRYELSFPHGRYTGKYFHVSIL